MRIYYLSPDGDDRNAGSESQPFASPYRARDAVRHTLRDRGGKGDIHVVFKPGRYHLPQTLTLGPEDGVGAQARRVVWRAFEAGSVRLSGAVPVGDWQRLKDEPDYLNPRARGKVWVARLPENCRPRDLFDRKGMVGRARGPGFLPVDSRARHSLSCQSFQFSGTYLQNWPDLREAELVVVPRNPWTMNILPLAEVDAETGRAMVARPCTYPIGIPGNGKFDHTLWVENTLAVLTPESWVFHEATRTLYYCTEKDAPASGLMAASLTEYILVQGQLDVPKTPDLPVAGLTFEGLIFEHGNRFPFHGGTGRGIQHDWEMFDAPSCMLRLRGAENCRIENCRFENSGAGGLRLDLLCRQNQVNNCEFHSLGGCGIVLAGYGPGLKYANRDNQITGNHIHHIGRHYYHSPGIFVWQSGANLVADNHLHDLPYTGIVCSGRVKLVRRPGSEGVETIRWHEVEELLGPGYSQPPWYHGWLVDWWRREPLQHARENLIEYNRIHDVMQVMGDGNGIYISGGGGGNVARFNAVGPCPSANMSEGIRCDDDQHQTIVHGNLIFKQAGHATGITTKGINRITNNIVALPLTNPIRGLLSLETGPQAGSVIRNNVFLTETSEQAFVWQSRIHGDGRRALLRDADCDRNLYWCVEDPEAARRHLAREQDFGIEAGGRAEDPGFVAPQNGDYRLKPDSPLASLGFRPLPLERMGFPL